MQFTQNITGDDRKPVLKTYLNLVRFLNDYFTYRKLKDDAFSYEMWAMELGFKSKASVRMICQGKRNVTDSFLAAFAKREKYSSDDLDYLQLLNFYQKANSDSLKKCLLEKIIEKFDVNDSQKNVKNYIQFLSSIEIPVVQILISFEDFKATEKNLKEALGHDTKTLNEYLRILEELELVQQIQSEGAEESYWISKNKLFKIPGEISDPAIGLFHAQTMKEAQTRLQSLSLYNQFRTLYFSLDQAAFEDICETLNDVANRLKVKYCNNYINDKRLFKFNFQLYPVTDLLNTASKMS